MQNISGRWTNRPVFGYTEKHMMTFFVLILFAWLVVNLLHAAWLAVRSAAWEERVGRGPDGLLPEAAAYRIGNGSIGLLFIHGFADTPRIWYRMARHLAEDGRFTCRAMRLPGSAEPAESARRQSLVRWRTHVADEVLRLRASHRSVWIVGHSMGAALALDAALRTPGIVDGVALFAPMIKVSPKRSPVLPPAVWFRLAKVVFGLSPMFESCFSAMGVAVDDPGFTYARDRFIPFAVYDGLFALIRANRKMAQRLTCPVFAVTAEHDSVIDTPAALKWLEACGGPKEIRALADIGHVIPLEVGWTGLAEAMAAFIRTHTPPTTPEE